MNNNIKILIIGIILLSSIGTFIALIILFNKKKKYQKRYQYIYSPKDVTAQKDAPKTDNFNKIEECVEVCEDNPYCTGLTYNTNNNKCTMVSRGVLVEGTDKHIAWVKDNVDKSLLLDTLISKNPRNGESIPNKNIGKGLDDKFCIAFNMNILDFYNSSTNNPDKENDYKVWKHILHKGVLLKDQKIMESDKWEDIVDNKKIGSVYSQDIGLWLAPYTNNIRICFKIDTSADNMNEKNDYIINNIQYIDIRNVPINEFFFIAVNVNDRIIEVYINNKIHTVTVLSGSVKISNEPIHIKYKPTFDGEIKNIHFIPDYASFDKIINLYNQK